MMKLWDRCLVQKHRPSSKLGDIAPWVCTLKNLALGYDVGKINAGCLVFSVYMYCQINYFEYIKSFQKMFMSV